MEGGTEHWILNGCWEVTGVTPGAAQAAVIIGVICRSKLWKRHWTWVKGGGGGPSRRVQFRWLQPGDGDVTNTARRRRERKENMLSLFRRAAGTAAGSSGKATAKEMWREPRKRGLCFGWRPTKSRSRENRGRGAPTVRVLSTQDVSTGLDL